MVLGFELRASHLLGRHSMTQATSLALPVLVILEIGSPLIYLFISLTRLTYTMILLFYTSCYH
jgi:hypothetical protein